MLSVEKKTTSSPIPWFWLFVLTAVAILIEGYHLGVDDAEIYIAAVKRVVNSRLYPFGEEYFLSHAKLSLFAPVVGFSSRFFHLPIDSTIFLWHIASILVFLLAGWHIARLCFSNSHARWASVTLLACSLAVPAAGTALVLMDPYVTARSISTPASLMAIACFLEKRNLRAALWLILLTVVHPQMAVYVFGFLLVHYFSEKLLSTRTSVEEAEKSIAAAAWIPGRIPKGFDLQPAQGAYRETLHMRTFFFVSQWHWYEWVGVFAPLAVLFGLTRISWRGTLPAFQKIIRTLIPFGICATGIALLLTSTPLFENFVRLQPMRCFHLLYIFLFLLLGGLIGEYCLQKRVWRWAALFLPLAFGMFFLEHNMYPSSRHIEWPAQRESNEWVQAFLWIRSNTPEDAVFAMDPKYMYLPEEDQHGFRAIAERSRLTDYFKDSGVASLFPSVSEEWERQQMAMEGWSSFTAKDFKRLAQKYPVSWLVLWRPVPAGLECPYKNPHIAVCKIPQ
jgi:hypothetical protein